MTKSSSLMWQGVWRAAAVAAVAAALGPLGCATAKREVPPGPPMPVDTAALAAANMQVLWKTVVPVPGGQSLTHLWLDGPYLTALDSNNQVYLMDSATGVRRWWMQVAKGFQTVQPPAVYKDELWVPTTTTLWTIQCSTGKVLTKMPLEFLPSTGCVTNGTHVYMGASRGYLEGVSISRDTASWGRWTDGAITSRPLLDSGHIYFASNSGEIYASEQRMRRVVWDYRAEGAVLADLKLSKAGLVLAASMDYSVYAFEASSGRLVWRFDGGEPVKKPAYPYGGQVYVFTDSQGLRALDETTGRVQWQNKDAADFVAGAGDDVFLLGRDGSLMVLGRTGGQVKYVLPLYRGTIAALNEMGDGVLYLTTPGGQVMAVSKKAGPGEAAPAP